MNDLPTEALGRLERFLGRDHEGVGELGRTRVLLHGQKRPRAIVLLHGLSASPTQFSRFATDLHQRGHNVLVPRLPKHGYSDRLSDALAGMTEDGLRQTARESVALAHDFGDRVTVAGFSLGGLLAAWIAQHEEVERAIAIAPFLGVSWIPNRWMSPLAEVALMLPNRFQWWNPIARERQMPTHGYPRFATHALARSYRLANIVMHDAATQALHAREMLFVTNANEAAVNNRAVHRLADRMRIHSDAHVELVEIGDLPMSHDIIEPLRNPNLADRVYPQLLELIDPSIGART